MLVSCGVVCTEPGQSAACRSSCLSLSAPPPGPPPSPATRAPGHEKLVSCHLPLVLGAVLVAVVAVSLSWSP